MKFQESGKFGEGFVRYLHGNMSSEEAMSKAAEIETSEMFDNDMLVTAIEFMFYSNNI